MKLADTKKKQGIIKHLLFPAFAVLLIFSSCQKEVTGDIGTPNAPAGSANKVKTYTEDATLTNGQRVTQTYNLTYDSNDRLISLISATSPGDKFVYKYNSDNTYTMDLYNSNVLSIHEVFYLNSIPLVDSTMQYDASLNDTTTEKYLYNANKQLVKLRQYRYTRAAGSVLENTVNSSYDNLGNVIKEDESAANTVYDYYPDLVNNLYLGLIYFSQSKNLVKTTTNTVPFISKVIINHTYTFDSSNRVSTQKDVYDNGSIVIKTFTY